MRTVQTQWWGYRPQWGIRPPEAAIIHRYVLEQAGKRRRWGGPPRVSLNLAFRARVGEDPACAV